ncbi:hypothetical protein HU200_035815 [Digitaria exilis]|uniref:Uncharacterized protein n=1 Tax=Digitaria exilis TaxID=1010633 RepID=A0A835EKU6_9POAL|nr:hypothetical protein HU200_035815 [Digitaria exilis]
MVGFAVLACNSVLAIHKSRGDAASVAFVLAADAALVLSSTTDLPWRTDNDTTIPPSLTKLGFAPVHSSYLLGLRRLHARPSLSGRLARGRRGRRSTNAKAVRAGPDDASRLLTAMFGELGGPPGLFSPSGLYTHKPPSTLSPEEQPCAPNWVAPEPRLSLKKKFEALSKIQPKQGHKEESGSHEAPTGDMPSIEDPISDWPTSNLKDKHIKALEADGFLAAQEISRWRCAHEHEYPTEETEEIAGMKPVYLEYTTKESLKDWQKEWFYAWNHQPQLPSRSGNPPIRCANTSIILKRHLYLKNLTSPMPMRNNRCQKNPVPKQGATSKGGERSKRAASTEPMAPVPKKARTLPKPRARAIPEERAKISSHRKSSSSVGIAIGEIGTSMPQQGSSARQPLSDEEILHNIFNPVSAPFIRTTPVVEEPCPAAPSAPEQEAEEEFILREPEIPMRPSSIVEEISSTIREEPIVDHAAVEPEATVPEEPREVPETTLPEVQTATPSNPPASVEAPVEETIAEVQVDIEQLVTQAALEETEVERRDQNAAEPPSVMETSQSHDTTRHGPNGQQAQGGETQRLNALKQLAIDLAFTSPVLPGRLLPPNPNPPISQTQSPNLAAAMSRRDDSRMATLHGGARTPD